MSFLLINICIIQINDNKVRGFPQVVATIWIDWWVFRVKGVRRKKKKQRTVCKNTEQQKDRCRYPAKMASILWGGREEDLILLFLNDLPFKNLGTPQNAHLENNVKGKTGFVFDVDFSEVSFDDLMISKKNSLKVSSSICFCWKSWPFLICYKFSFWTGSVKQQWVMAKWLVSPMPHNILGKKV